MLMGFGNSVKLIPALHVDSVQLWFGFGFGLFFRETGSQPHLTCKDIFK